MRLIGLAIVLAVSLALAPRAVEAQQTTTVPRIGFLRSGPPPQAFVEGFQQGLRELGYLEGQNIIIEYRIADKGPAQLADLGSELLRLKVDVILASATPGRPRRQEPDTNGSDCVRGRPRSC